MDLSKCGLNYCPWTNTTSAESEEAKESSADDNFSASKEQLYILAGVYLFCSILSAFVVAFLVDPLSKYRTILNFAHEIVIGTLPTFRFEEAERGNGKEKRSGFQLLVATFSHMKKPYQVLIIPLTFWSGVEQGFFGADFTAVRT